MSKDPDAMLVRACLAGDSTAFDALVQRYSVKLFNATYRITHSRDDAIDATQEAFAKAFEKLHTFDFAHRFFSWIYRIALNEALDIAGRRRREVALTEDVPMPTGDLEREVVEGERTELLQRALMELRPDQRALVVFRHIQGMSYADIAEIVGVAERTVKSRLFDAREKLRQVMTERRWLS